MDAEDRQARRRDFRERLRSEAEAGETDQAAGLGISWMPLTASPAQARETEAGADGLALRSATLKL